ncbi:MAG: polysaccharide deacetylase family protein [Burkholderiales bacterium]
MTPAGQARAWQPSMAIKLSVAFHAALFLVLLVQPAAWTGIASLAIANHVVLGLIGMWPRSRWLGRNLLRLPDDAVRRKEIALTFDDGPDPLVTPRVLDLLDRHGAKASFFVVGEKALAHPELVREIVRRGHSVENHSHRHSNFFGFFGWSALRQEIETAQSAIEDIIRRRPVFFRSPMGIRNPILDPVIATLGMQYITWTRRGFDTVTPNANKVLARLTRGLGAGDILLMHDRSCGTREPVVLLVLPVLLERIRLLGLHSVSLPMAFPETRETGPRSP